MSRTGLAYDMVSSVEGLGMEIEVDATKRAHVLHERGLDLADAGKVFGGFHLTRHDEAHSADEDRFITVGAIDQQIVLVVWTCRNGNRRIVTMWKCNERERQAYLRRRDAC